MSGPASPQYVQTSVWGLAACCWLWLLLGLPHMADAREAYGSSAKWRKDWTGLAFNYQLIEVFTSDHYIPGVKIYGFDGFDNEESMVRKLVRSGALPVCYVSGGTFEEWRPDAADFLPADKGNPLGDWPGENYINILSPNVRQIMYKRILMCKNKGFVAVDVDNVDLFEADASLTGFSLTEDQGKEYVLWLAKTAHSMGMAYGLKNAINLLQHPEVVRAVDFAVNEQALAMEEAALYRPLWKAGKAILNIEYEESWSMEDWLAKACPQQRKTGLLSILKTRLLTAKPWAKCPAKFKPSRFPPKHLDLGSSVGYKAVLGSKAPTYVKKRADKARSKAAAAGRFVAPSSAVGVPASDVFAACG